MVKNKQIELKKEVSSYETSKLKSSIWQMVNTFIPFFGLWFLGYECLSFSYILTFLCALVASGFLIRMFIIFHDCCHYSFFKSKRANKIVGTIISVLTLFPYRQWQRNHAIHHATSGNLDKRGTGDIWLMTVDEYERSSRFEKMKYILYRHPFVLFILGPIWEFLIKQRFNRKQAKRKERMNTYIINVSVVILYGFICWLIGWKSFLMIQLPIFWISSILGIWLFYVQHHFEDSYYEWDEQWEYVKAATEGSSFYKLPKVLQWMTGNIGYHHVHHLSSRIPNYSLEMAHNHSEALKNIPTLTISQSLAALRFRLWDEEKKVFIGFKTFKNRKMKNKFRS